MSNMPPYEACNLCIQNSLGNIDKLTTVINELSSKLDRKDNSTQYKPRIHPGRNRGHGQRQNRYNF